jgi:hypothetical protein
VPSLYVNRKARPLYVQTYNENDGDRKMLTIAATDVESRLGVGRDQVIQLDRELDRTNLDHLLAEQNGAVNQ